MNKLAAVLLLVMVVSCSYKDVSPQLVSVENSFSVKRNNLDWTGTTEIHLDNVTDTLTFFGIANRPNDHVIVMKIKFTGTGSYSLSNNQGRYYSTVGGDVLTSEYKFVPNTMGQFVVTKYLQAEKIIEGSFEMSLKKIWSNPENNIDTYNFTQGTFKGKFYN